MQHDDTGSVASIRRQVPAWPKLHLSSRHRKDRPPYLPYKRRTPPREYLGYPQFERQVENRDASHASARLRLAPAGCGFVENPEAGFPQAHSLDDDWIREQIGMAQQIEKSARTAMDTKLTTQYITTRQSCSLARLKSGPADGVHLTTRLGRRKQPK